MHVDGFDPTLPDPLMAQLQSHKGTAKFFWFQSTDDIANCVLTLNKWLNGPWAPEPKPRFGYSKDMEHAIQQLRYGWDQMIKGIDLTDVALSIPREIKSEFERSAAPQGAQVDVGRYLEGQPECMYDFQPNIARKKTVRLFMNMSADCGASSRLIERGKALTSCIDWLERSGFRVRLDVGDCFSGWSVKREEGWCIAFCAKDYDQAVDIERISFITGSPTMLMRIFFGIECTSKAMLDTFHGTQGGVAPVPKYLREEYDYIIEYGAPFNKDIAEKIVEQIVTGQQPKQPTLIDDGAFDWSSFERYEAPPPPPIDSFVPLWRPKDVKTFMDQINALIAEMQAGAVDGEGSGEGEGSGDGDPPMLYKEPTKYQGGYWYLVKPGPKMDKLIKEHREKYGKPEETGGTDPGKDVQP